MSANDDFVAVGCLLMVDSVAVLIVVPELLVDMDPRESVKKEDDTKKF